MNSSINSKTLGTIGSFVVLIATVAGFWWMWNSAQPNAATATSVDLSKYQTIDISGLKSQAASLVSTRTNVGNLPVVAPASDQVGRENPFAGL